VRISKDSIDLGIVVKDVEGCLRFYGELLGLPRESDLPIPGGTMYRFLAGTTLIKLLHLGGGQPPSPPGLAGALGYRYYTITVEDLDGTAAELEAKGVPMVMRPRELLPGVRVAMISDPDGNVVELLQG
jgi:lactoylglutathione lyase